jgi:prevent-host-death family protein
MKSRKQVNVHEAKTHLSRLLEEVAAGSEIVIARAGEPVARLTSIKPETRARKPGFLKGRIRIATDFDAPLPDELVDAFEGRRK